ncbi:MAG: EAL domain-containing protein [Fimbriimonadaceae bacterium]
MGESFLARGVNAFPEFPDARGGTDIVGFFEWDLVGNLLHWDDACYRIFEVAPEIEPRVGLRSRVAPDELDRVREIFADSSGTGPRCYTEIEVHDERGETRQLGLLAWIRHANNGSPMSAIGAYICQEPGSVEVSAALSEIASQIPGFLYQFRIYADGREEFSYVGEQCLELCGLTRAQITADAKCFWDLAEESHREVVRQSRARSMQTGERIHQTFPIRLTATGEQRWLQLQAIPRADVDGSITWNGVATDATNQKAVESQMESQSLLVRQQLAEINNKNHELEQRQSELATAYQQLRILSQTDPLTGVFNRNAFQLYLSKLSFFPGFGTHLILVDLDSFRELNNSIGHHNGDAVLRCVADRITKGIPSTDRVARLSGDVFALVVSLDRSSTIEGVCQMISQELAAPIIVDQLSIRLTCSIGAAAVEQVTSEEDDTTMLRADMALQVAKANGGNQAVAYNEALGCEFERRLAIERDLNRALPNGELFLMYQPIVDMETGRLAGFEALCRWEHPERGMISPADFIPIAEKTGLIVPLGEWVLRTATKQIQDWRTDFGLTDEFITVNVSGSQLMREDFESIVHDALDTSGLDPKNLKLEVTETLMVTSSQDSVVALSRIRERGVRVALDDFGTGFSSIGALRYLPIDTIKLDRSFVRLAGDLSEDTSIIQAILSIARAMRADVVAEGIESIEQAAHLRMLGCELAQGFYFSRPLSVAQVEKMLADDQFVFGEKVA